jgi:outer membrane protein TolC
VLEVLDAQRALARARTDEVGAVVDMDRAQFELVRAIGEPPR